MNYGINFTVSIKKAGKEMLFNCSAGDTVSIHNVKISSESNSTEATYDGPPFENLSDSLQEAFVQYLEERKINSDMSEFILSYSQAKEQKEYVHWLKTFAQFTEAK
jgi:complement component 1 Q subcomponent-binding protein